MADGHQTKRSVVIVYTGEGKGKTSASLGLAIRALGAGHSVAYVQFIKHWQVSEHDFIDDISDLYGDKLILYKGGKGFYNAGDMSAGGVSDAQHKQAAEETLEYAANASSSGKYNLVVCDEISNAVHDGLLVSDAFDLLIDGRHPDTSLCLTGRNFPEELLDKVDIATSMDKLRHHYDDGYIANKGIDY